MTREEDLIAPEEKYRAAAKGTLFRTLTAVFSMQDLQGGFNGVSSEQVFYDGLAGRILQDFAALDCMGIFKETSGIHPSVPNDDKQVADVIENIASQYWTELLRYRTPQEVKEDYREVKPCYDRLMQNGRHSWCELEKMPEHSMQAIQTLVMAHRMYEKTAEMLKMINPSFSLDYSGTTK